MKTERLIMFDIDGTILKTGSEDFLFGESMKECLSIKSIDMDWTNYKNVTDSGIVSELFLQVKGYIPSMEDIDLARDIFYLKWEKELIGNPHSCVPIIGVNQFIEQLRKIPGVTLAIATGGWEKTAKLKLAHTAFPFSDISFASSSDASSREQIMRIAYERALDKANISHFTNVIYFGDGLWDFMASTNLGFGFVAIDTSNRKQKFIEMGVKYIFEDFSDCERLIDLISTQ
jgi:phosphoglycolate phosphatase-like HAD superfamily hydrolase